MKLKRLMERRPNEANKERTIIYYCCPAKVLCIYRTASIKICYENN